MRGLIDEVLWFHSIITRMLEYEHYSFHDIIQTWANIYLDSDTIHAYMYTIQLAIDTLSIQRMQYVPDEHLID